YDQHFVNVMNFSISEMVFKSHKQFLESAGRVLSTDGMEPREVFPGHFSHLDKLREYIDYTRPARLETGVSRAVDNFLSYISDILTQAIISRPDLLKSQEQVTMEEVLGHDSIEEFVQWAAERHINQLSFKGLDEIARYVEKRLGLSIHSSSDDWQTLKSAVAARNLIVHRRAVIDDRFLRVIKDADLSKGDRFQVPTRMLADTLDCTMRVVHDFDARIAKKFSVSRLRSEDQEWYLKVHKKKRVSLEKTDSPAR
ncbi:hypothetical protein, partial [Streptomyces antibioticus]